MEDDFSVIRSGGCNVLSGSDTIVNYNGNSRFTYHSLGGKWYLYRTEYNFNNQPYDISTYNCLTLTGLSSNAQFEPIFYGIAFFLFLVGAGLFFKLVRRLISWR